MLRAKVIEKGFQSFFWWEIKLNFFLDSFALNQLQMNFEEQNFPETFRFYQKADVELVFCFLLFSSFKFSTNWKLSLLLVISGFALVGDGGEGREGKQ